MPPSPKNRPRRDPPRRKTFTGFDPTKLLNPDPSKRYKFVDKAAKMGGVRSHESHGWEIVSFTKDGPQLRIGTESRMGEPIEMDDMILMCIDREEHARVQREGQYGESGQELLDAIDAQIINPGGIDGLAVSPTEDLDVVNETKRSQRFDSAAV